MTSPSTPALRFRTKVVLGGKTATGLEVPAAVVAGDEVEVEVELDDAPRSIEVPPDLAEALAEEPAATSFFESLSFSKQRWFTESVTGAKSPRRGNGRVEKAIEMLREGRSGG